MSSPGPAGRRQGGAALVTALALMLVVLMLGIAAARTALNGARSAQVGSDRQIALQAAEAALADAERDIAGGASPPPVRAAAFAAGGAALAAGCGRAGDTLGLCRAVPPPARPAWQGADIEGEAGVPYGRFTGALLPAGSGLLPARLPRYIVEPVALAGGAAAGQFYRITAIGFGRMASTRVVLQSVCRKAPVAGNGAPAPGKRVSWREIENWAELHQAAAR